MIVDSVSPTPFALLRRANNFQYRDEDRALQDFSNYEDPVKALTDECKRVLRSISASNQTQISSSTNATGLKDASWSRFEDIGFSGAFDEAEEDEIIGSFGMKKRENAQSLRSTPHSDTLNMGRPTTPSWADFLSSGFVDEKPNSPTPLLALLPPDKILPPIETSRGRSSQSHRPRLESDRNVEPGELASISKFDLDESFWWVWISSLAGEEPAERKAAFGRCALVETVVRHGKWLVIEEIVKGAAPEPAAGAYVAEKKSRFGWTKRSKGMSRSKSNVGKPDDKNNSLRPSYNTSQNGVSKTSIGPDQHARIQAAAAQLQQKKREQEAQQEAQARRGREDTDAANKTNSVLSLQPGVISELSPAMKWASKYDKEAVREAYLANNNTGKGAHANGQSNGNGHLDSAASPPRNITSERDLPSVPPPSKRSEAELSKAVESIMSPAATTPASLPPTHAEKYKEPGSKLPEKAAEAGLPKDPHPVERPTTPIKKKPESQSHLITPPRKTQGQSLAQFLSEEDPSSNTASAIASAESPDHQNKLKKKAAGGGGFKKMFGRNKNRDSFQKAPEAAAPAQAPKDMQKTIQGQLQPGGATLGRRFSGFRKKSSPETTSLVSTPTPASIAESEDRTPTRTPEPEAQHAYERSYNPSVQESLSRVDTADAHEARQAFSSFDQGPLEDVPAFVPNDSPTPSSRPSYDAPRPPVVWKVPLAPVSLAAPIAPAAPNAFIAVEADSTKTVTPAQDRWAQIRKNAAERAAARQSEDQKSAATDGDGETSGEESKLLDVLVLGKYANNPQPSKVVSPESRPELQS
jgi:hypothetical protein